MAKRCRAQNWVFTINNYTPEVEQRLKELDCEWMIFGHEIGENGTPHLQGAIHFKGRRDASALGKLFPWHIEVMHGSCQDSKTYCTKEDTTGYFEKGIMPEDTKVNSKKNKINWEEVYALAREGDFDSIRRDVYIRYRNALHQIYFDARSDPDMNDYDNNDLKKHFLWLYGPTGTGKSHTARRIAKELGCDMPYLKDLNKWWNGYSYQKVTIIEEADPDRCKYLPDYFKKWCDKWAFTAECKGNVINACRPEYIIVTSNYSMSECFPDPNNYAPLSRRFTEVCLNSKDKHVYWPLTQPEFEEQQRLSNENGAGLFRDTGNSTPCPGGNSIGIELQSSQPSCSESIEDITSEQEEEERKRRRISE